MYRGFLHYLDGHIKTETGTGHHETQAEAWEALDRLRASKANIIVLSYGVLESHHG